MALQYRGWGVRQRHLSPRGRFEGIDLLDDALSYKDRKTRQFSMMGTSRVMRLLLPSLFLPNNRSSYRKQIRTATPSHNAEINKPRVLSVTVDTIRHRIHSGTSSMLGTTVLCVRKDQTVVIIADGQVTLGSQIVKPNVRKLRRIGENVIGGFAGATADALTLFERLENQLEEHSGQLTRAAVELAKAWRTDKFLRRLDAVMVVADSEITLTITGNGDVLEPHDGVVAIGSGGPYAIAAARALIDLPNFNAESVARKAMKIAADSCIYTNHNFTIERIESQTTESSEVGSQPVAKSICDSSNNVLKVASSEHCESSGSDNPISSDPAVEKDTDKSI